MHLYDGQVVCEINSSGTPLIFYGYGASGLSEKYDANAGITYAYTFDPAGNVVERHQNSTTVNPSDWTTLYDAFGASHGAIEVNGQQQSNQLNIESVGFGGQWGYYTDNEIDQVTGVVPQGRLAWTLNGLRYYDPATGRFLTRDPIGYEGGINLYTFCGNNPINHADPSGLQTLDSPSASFWQALRAGNVKDAGFFLRQLGMTGAKSRIYDSCLRAYIHYPAIFGALKGALEILSESPSVPRNKSGSPVCVEQAVVIKRTLEKLGVENAEIMWMRAKNQSAFGVSGSSEKWSYHVFVRAGDLVLDSINGGKAQAFDVWKTQFTTTSESVRFLGLKLWSRPVTFENYYQIVPEELSYTFAPGSKR